MLKKAMWPLLIILSFLLSANSAYAAGATFSVSPILNLQQVSGASYFDMLVRSGKSYTLSLRVENYTQHTQTLQISLNPAQTNQQGQLEYGKKNNNNLNDLNLNELITGPKSIKLAPHEIRTISYQLTVPSKKFEGALVGAFVVTSPEENSESVGLTNRFSYEIGVMVREKKTEPKPDFSFENLHIKNQQLFVDIVNNSAGRLSQAELNGNLTGTSTKKFQQKISIVAFDKATLALPLQKLTPGTYQLNLSVATSDVVFNQNFKIIQKGDSFYLRKRKPSVVIFISAFAGVVGLSLFYFYQKRKKEG